MLAGAFRNTVLLVEDDSGFRSLLRTALTAAGYIVVAVEDGIDALRRIEHEVPHAVVLDLALPRMGGRDVNRELKARAATRDVPVVVVSGADTADLPPNEFACVLRKPIDPDSVVEAVQRCVRARRLDVL